MYSKEALDLYEELLKKLPSKVKFVEKTASVAQGAKNLLKDSGWLAPFLTGSALTVPSFLAGKYMQGAASDWDKSKYLLGGLGVGLTAPLLYNYLKGGNALKALGYSDYTPEYADFSSI